MIEIRKPASMDANDFYPTMVGISRIALKSVERRNKGKSDDHYIAKWDETITTAPTEAEMLAGSVLITLDSAKEVKKTSIAANYKAAEDALVTVGGFNFDADSEALTQAMSVIVAMQEGFVLPGNFSWPDSGGVARAFNTVQIKNLFKKISVKNYKDAHRKSRLMKQVKRANTLAEVAAVVDW